MDRIREIVGSKDRNHQHQTTGVLLFGGRPMFTMWIPAAKKVGEREVSLSVRKECKYRGINYQSDVALAFEPITNPAKCVYRGVAYNQCGAGSWAYCSDHLVETK